MNFDFMIFGAKLVSKPLGLCPRLQNVAFLETILILRKGVLILQACFVGSKITPTTSIRNYSVSSALIALQSFGVLGRYS